ncbi:uncharacterized protein ACIGJ3_017163 isoform 18-T39 [Trichechus inunguis]
MFRPLSGDTSKLSGSAFGTCNDQDVNLVERSRGVNGGLKAPSSPTGLHGGGGSDFLATGRRAPVRHSQDSAYLRTLYITRSRKKSEHVHGGKNPRQMEMAPQAGAHEELSSWYIWQQIASDLTRCQESVSNRSQFYKQVGRSQDSAYLRTLYVTRSRKKNEHIHGIVDIQGRGCGLH